MFLAVTDIVCLFINFFLYVVPVLTKPLWFPVSDYTAPWALRFPQYLCTAHTNYIYSALEYGQKHVMQPEQLREMTEFTNTIITVLRSHKRGTIMSPTVALHKRGKTLDINNMLLRETCWKKLFRNTGSTYFSSNSLTILSCLLLNLP